ncbi:MAG: DUF2892 domain-containing protein [Candidatus Kapaibacterium sp.]
MIKNMGMIDRSIRFVLVVLVGVLWYLDIIQGVTALVLGALSIGFLFSGITGFCPLYVLFGVSTCNVKQQESR